MRGVQRLAVGLALGLGLGLVSAPAATARSADTPPVTIVYYTFTDPTSLSVEYGQYWLFHYTVSKALQVIPGYGAHGMTVDGAPSGYTATDTYFCFTCDPNEGLVSPSPTARPLDVGQYSIAGEFDYTSPASEFNISHHGVTLDPATLTVKPAQLGIVAHIGADPSNADAVTISAEFTGRFVDGFESSNDSWAALAPAGEWRIQLADETGTVVKEERIARAAGGDTLATSLLWAGAKPETEYTATVSFTPSGTSGANFSVGKATPVSYTTPEVQRAIPTATATAAASGSPAPTLAVPLDDAELSGASAISVPPWGLIATLVLLVGLSAVVTTFSVRLRKTAASYGSSVETTPPDAA